MREMKSNGEMVTVCGSCATKRGLGLTMLMVKGQCHCCGQKEGDFHEYPESKVPERELSAEELTKRFTFAQQPDRQTFQPELLPRY